MEKTAQEELLEKQLARCAEALDACLDGAAEARGKNWAATRVSELRDATRLMGASARLVNALARLRQPVRPQGENMRSKNCGSNGQAHRQT